MHLTIRVERLTTINADQFGSLSHGIWREIAKKHVKISREVCLRRVFHWKYISGEIDHMVSGPLPIPYEFLEAALDWPEGML